MILITSIKQFKTLQMKTIQKVIHLIIHTKKQLITMKQIMIIKNLESIQEP